MAALFQKTPQFQLAAVLADHRADVKAVAEAGPGRLVTASRDGTVKLWQAVPGSAPTDPATVWTVQATYAAHTGYVNSVAYLAPTALFPEGLILSGGQDRLILGHTPSNTAAPALTLVGHTGNVCTLATTVDATTGHPLLVSGSWDMTARVWDLATAQTLRTLGGHTMAVWAVAALDNGDVATASADKTIRLWRGSTCVHTLTGHTDCIRALAVVPGLGFLSAANDATLRLWSGDGEALQELVGHTAYVYSVALLATGEIVSSGEDRSLRVWHDGQCIQTVLHPADSVWAVAALANGDVATATNDGVVRIFSRDPARAAPEAARQAFDASVAAHAIPAAAMDLDPSTVAGSEALAQPGRKDGEVKMVRNGDVIEAYQWQAGAGQWDKVGVVTEVRPQGKQMLNGAEYDYVFDVDLEDGLPPRKLPYNLGENPFTAAQNFIHREELSQTFLDQVAHFIVRNTKNARGAAPPPPPASSGFQMPGAYMSAEARGAAAAAAGASTHVPPVSNLPTGPTSLLPKRGAVALDGGNLPAIVKKLGELNGQLSNASDALSADDLQSLRLAAETIATTSRYHATSIFPGQLAALGRALRWPAAQRFPALDLLRLAVVHPSVPELYVDQPGGLLDLIVQGAQLQAADANEINRMMGVRALANLGCTSAGRRILASALPKIVALVASQPTSSASKPYHLALGTLHLNLAVLVSDPAVTVDAKVVVALLHAAVQHLHGTGLGDDAAFRTLVAVGTIAITDRAWRAFAIEQGALAASRQWGAKTGDQLVIQATVELAALLDE